MARLRPALDYAAFVAVRAILSIVQALPLDWCERGCGLLATVMQSVLKIRRRVVEENLRHAFPESTVAERRDIAWRMWRHLFLMVAEIAHARRKLHHTNWRQHVRLVNPEWMVKSVLDGRPAVLVTGHFGNFELAGYMVGVFGLPTVTVARTLDNPYLDAYLNEFREATGQHLVPKDGSAARVAWLQERGAMLTLLGDQSAGRKGCWVNFFGRPASAHKSIALFSLSARRPLLVSFARRRGAPLQYDLGLSALADPDLPEFRLDTVPELTQWYTAGLEELVRESPDQYWWVHRRWKGDPPASFFRKAA